MKKVEIIGGIAFVIGLAMKYLLIPGGRVLFILSSLLLIIVYSFLGIFIFLNINKNDWFNRDAYKNISQMRIVGAILSGIAMSIMILSMNLSFSGLGRVISFLGLIPLGIIFVISVVKFFQTKSEYYSRIMIRLGITAVSYVLITTAIRIFIFF